MQTLSRRARAALTLVVLCAPALPAQARRPIDGPTPPVAPDVISRSPDGRATVRAIKLTAPLTLDGVLDEEVYTREKPFGGLLQVAPDYGQPATERSDIWVMYDDRNVYVTCRCYDEAPPSLWVVNELRRDTGGLRNNEHFGVMFDTYYDRRSGFAFYTNPLGARADYSVVDEGGSNTDWNPVWSTKSGRFDGGWTVEMAIPLKSLRYRAGKNEVWGIQIRRSIRHKNEWDYLTPVPRILAGPQALNKISSGATLVGLDLPESGANLEIKPYAIARSTTDNVRTPAVKDQGSFDGGGDLKYAITPNLTADLTANTDFAQVEVDEQQVNLTRFSLFFPEKRDFFLEGRGIFDFARGGLGATTTDQSDMPYLFYSRRIGLNGSRVIPISGGGRLTGKVGPWAVGLMDIQTRADGAVGADATNFGVVRLKRDVLRNSAIGLMATNRSVGANGKGTNSSIGVDGAFLLTQELLVSTFWAQTQTTGKTGANQSYQGLIDYTDDTYGAHAERLMVGANFDPQVGFLRRSDFTRSFASVRYSPRPTRVIPSVRKFTWTASEQYYETGAGTVDSRAFNTSFTTEFQSSDQVVVGYAFPYERLPVPFTPSGSRSAIPAGTYTFPSASVAYTLGAQRRVSGTITVQAGQYYDGTIRSVTFGPAPNGFQPARISLTTRLAMEPSVTYTEVTRPNGSFVTRLARTRVDYAFSPLMFLSGLFQYSSADRAVNTNLRYRWEYAPGSEIFLVYTDERDATPDAYTPAPAVRGIKNRAFVVKVNRLFRF